MTLLVIDDPLPHLRRLLTSARLRDAPRAGKIGGMFRREIRQPRPTRTKDESSIEQNKRWVPREFALGIGAEAWQTSITWPAGWRLDLAQGAKAAGEKAAGELPKLKDDDASESGTLLC